MIKKDKHIKCIDCKYVRPDKFASTRGWTAYECGNPDSDYYRCLLNITEKGDRLKKIVWGGCEIGRGI